MAVTLEESHEPGRATKHRPEVLPYFVAFFGVVAACGFILAASGIDLDLWGPIHGDSNHVYEPQGVYGDGWNTAVFEPFSGGRLGFREAVLALVAYGGTFVIGERILRVLVGRMGWPTGLRVGAGFLIGYVPVFAVVRLITLRFDSDSAPLMCLTVVAASAGASLGFDMRRATDARAELTPRFYTSRMFWSIAALFGFMIIWTVQSGRNYLVSDSVLLFLGVARGDYGSMHWLPPFGRQMDEYLFNYPMIYAFGGASTFQLWFWLTNALAKASMVCLIAGFSWTLSKGKWLVGCMSAALVLFASPLANPAQYVSLFGGQNPAIYLGHAGRFLGIVLPFLVVLLLSEGNRRTGWAMSAVFGVAIMATSAHGVLYAGIIVFLAMAIVTGRALAKPRSDRARARLRRVADIGAIVALAAPFVTYGTLQNDANPGYGGVILIAGGLAAAAAIVWTCLGGDERDERDDGIGDALTSAQPGRLVPLAIGAVIGMLLMGNLFYKPLMENHAYRSVMRALFPAYEREPLFVMTFLSEPFTHASCFGVPTAACSSFRGWLGYFGLTAFAAIASWVIVRRSVAAAALRRRDMVLLMTQVLLLNAGFFLTDFLGAADAGTYWVQTRFIEVGYYGILIMMPVIVWNHLNGSARSAALVAISAWFVVPLVVHPFAQQWVTNLRHLRWVLM